MALADVPLERHDPHPAEPALTRDVALISDDSEFTHPFGPKHRTTTDGRVAVRVQRGVPPNGERLSSMISLLLFAPASLTAPIRPDPAKAGDAGRLQRLGKTDKRNA